MRRVTPLLIGLIALCSGGCEGDCPVLDLCDIRAPECQEQIFAAVSCLRGNPGELPEIKVRPAQQVVEEFVNEPIDPDARERSALFDRALYQLRLAPAETTVEETRAEHWENVLGFYDRDEMAITVLDWGRSSESIDAVHTLGHEMIHAMQGTEGLFEVVEEGMGRGLDGYLGGQAIYEGEAELYFNLAYIGMDGWSAGQLDWQASFSRWQEHAEERSSDSEFPVIAASQHFPYAFGSGFVYSAWEQGGPSAVTELFSAPPQSTREVRLGYEAWDSVRAAAEPGLGDASLPLPDGDLDLVTWSRMGSWICDAFARRLWVEGVDCLELVDDSLSVFVEAASQRVLVFWRLRFSSGELARSLEAQVATQLPLDTLVADRDVVFAGASEGALPILLEELRWGPPPIQPRSQRRSALEWLSGREVRAHDPRHAVAGVLELRQDRLLVTQR